MVVTPRASGGAASLVLIAVLAVGCSSAAATPKAAPTKAAGFDISAVRASFNEECRDPAVVDANFCQQVMIDRMSADGTILNVPTGLNPASLDRASAICDMLKVAHFDGSGKDLGYDTIGVMDRDGRYLISCSV